MTSGTKTALYMAAILTVTTGTALADLPGLPAAKPPEADSHPSDAHSAAPTPMGPVRGSLFKQGVVASAAPAMAGVDTPLPSMNFIAVHTPEPKRYRKNDIVTVVIREDSDSLTNGQGTNKKDQSFDLALQQFLQLAISNSGLPQVGTVNNPSNLPEIKFNYTNDGTTDNSQAALRTASRPASRRPWWTSNPTARWWSRRSSRSWWTRKSRPSSFPAFAAPMTSKLTTQC